MTTVYEPFLISWEENGKNLTKYHTSRKKAVAFARPLIRKGIAVGCASWEPHYEEWTSDGQLTEMLSRIEPVEKKPRSTSAGNHDAYVALDRLSAICSTLAPLARKKPLTDEQKTDLAEAIHSVIEHSGIGEPEENDPNYHGEEEESSWLSSSSR